YKEHKNFFPQFAIDPKSYLEMYPEYVVSNQEKQLFIKDKRSVLIGRKIADEHKLKPGDSMTLKGQIFPGTWDFIIAGIYEGKTKGTDTAQLFFHWDYLNEEIRKRGISRDKEAVGVFIVEVDNIDKVGSIAKSIRLVSYVVIIIIMLVMANTMIMTARERVWEYATLRSIGFGKFFLSGLIILEACLLALFGGIVGIALTFPAAEMFRTFTGTLFPVFEISNTTIIMQVLLSLLTGAFAAIFPAWKANTINIVGALRAS
ncbi:MAG: FtsX-like permease family protein, partial [Burkholderiaceae bacterium]